jgi:predicted ATPase
MLRRLKLENFKSWEKADLRLGAITGLFGSNSSGKTSLIQFLLMLKQTKENVDRSLSLDFGGEKSLADLGSFKDAIFAHETKREISWRLAWDLPDRLTISDPERKRSAKLFEGERIAIESSVRQRKNAFFTNRLAYYFSEVAFKLLAK